MLLSHEHLTFSSNLILFGKFPLWSTHPRTTRKCLLFCGTLLDDGSVLIFRKFSSFFEFSSRRLGNRSKMEDITVFLLSSDVDDVVWSILAWIVVSLVSLLHDSNFFHRFSKPSKAAKYSSWLLKRGILSKS